MTRYRQKINSELEVNLSILLSLSDTWFFKNHFIQFPKFYHLWKDVKPKWTQITLLESPKIFSRNNTASCLLHLHSVCKCLEKIISFFSDAWVDGIEKFSEFFYFSLTSKLITTETSPSVGSAGKEPTCSAGDIGDVDLVPGSENPLEKEMTTHSSILAWKIPWTNKPGRLQFNGLQRAGHNWATQHTGTESQTSV